MFITPNTINAEGSSYTVTISSKQAWTDTGITVSPGDIIHITATGSINYAPTSPATGPNGSGNPSGPSYLVLDPSIPTHSLVGNVAPTGSYSDGKGFFVGTSFEGSVPISGTTAQSGKLFLGFNDGFIEGGRTSMNTGAVGDNSGSFTAEISITTSTAQFSVSSAQWYRNGLGITTATTDDTVIARVTVSGGEPGLYEMDIKRDISWATDEIISCKSFSHDGSTTNCELSYSPPYATGESNTDGYFISVVKDGNELWSLPNAYPPRLRVTRNNAPIAYIDRIAPDQIKVGDVISFSGYGTDSDGSISAYSWRSNIDGPLSVSNSFMTSTLSPGNHTIFFKVKDNHEKWSIEVARSIMVKPDSQPSAYINSVSPDRGKPESIITFEGYGNDIDGVIVSYNWESSIDGSLSSSSSFSTSQLSIGMHSITFKVQDDSGQWSEPVIARVIIEPNGAPVAYIDTMSRSEITVGEKVTFDGKGIDSDGEITGYNWRSNIDGQLSTSNSFSTSDLSIGDHIIFFKVKDNSDKWSEEVSVPVKVSGFKPYVNLYGTTTGSIVGKEPVILELSTINPITSPGTLHVQLTLKIPSGWSITSSGFSHGAGGLRTNSYDIEQGPNARTIYVDLMPNEPFEGEITGYIDYYFDETKDRFRDEISLPVSASLQAANIEEEEKDNENIKSNEDTRDNSNGGLSCFRSNKEASDSNQLLAWSPIGLIWIGLIGGFTVNRRKKK